GFDERTALAPVPAPSRPTREEAGRESPAATPAFGAGIPSGEEATSPAFGAESFSGEATAGLAFGAGFPPAEDAAGPAPPPLAGPEPPAPPRAAAVPAAPLRIGADALDRVLDGIGELVFLRGRLARALATEDEPTRRELDRLRKIAERLFRDVMRMRLVAF